MSRIVGNNAQNNKEIIDAFDEHKNSSQKAGLLIDHLPSQGDGNAEIRSEIRAGICSVTGKILEVCDIGYRMENHPDCIYFFLTFGNYNIRVLVDTIKQQLFNQRDHVPVNIYYTDCLKSDEEVKTQLDYMAEHLIYSLIYGYWKRFPYSFIYDSEQNKELPVPDAAAEIAAFLERRDFPGLKQYIEGQENQIMTWRHVSGVPFSSHGIYLFMETLMYALKIFFQANSWRNPLDDLTLPGLLLEQRDIHDFFLFMENCLTEYEAFIRPNMNGHKHLMDMMILHIEQNLPTVTLASLAECFHLTSAYVSRAFKSYTGENFSDFVTQRKLNRAAQMLTQDISIRDISVQLGYSSPAYFLAKFKEKYGMTPSSYRRRHLVHELSDSNPSENIH